MTLRREIADRRSMGEHAMVWPLDSCVKNNLTVTEALTPLQCYAAQLLEVRA